MSIRFPLSAVAAAVLTSLAGLGSATGAQAQPAAADPLDARAAVPAFVYRSSLADYRRAGAVEPVAWREANDLVRRIGGWRAYLREAHTPEPPPSAPVPEPPAPRPAEP